MNVPDNMTLKATVENKGDFGSGKREKKVSLSDRFSWPGRIAVLLAVVLSPWAIASVPHWAQRWIMILLLVALGFWWFETALNRKKSQVFPYMFYLVAFGVLVGVIQLIPLPDFLVNLLAERQSEIYKQYSGDPNAAVTISLDREGTWHQLRLLVMGISGLLLGCRFFRTKRDVVLLLSVVTINGVLLTAFGLSQMYVTSRVYCWIEMNPVSFGAHVNPNNAGGYLAMCLACCIGLYLIVSGKENKSGGTNSISNKISFFQRFYYQFVQYLAGLTTVKIMILLASAFLVFGVVATASRGSAVAILGAGVGTLLMYGVARKPKNTMFVFLPVIGLVLVLSLWLGVGETIVSKFEEIDMVNVTDADVRIAHWKDTYPAVAEMGLLGGGLGAYRRVHRLYRSDHELGIFEFAENQFFQSLVEAGWLGLIVFLTAWCLAFQYAYLLLFKGNSAISIGVGTCGFFVLFSQMLASCFDFGFYIPSNLLLVATLVGFLAYQSQSLAGRLKDRTWLRFVTPNYFVQVICLAIFAGATISTLELHKLASIDALLWPRKTAEITRENLPIELTEQRIVQLSNRLSGTSYSRGQNYLGELYLHRSRLLTFDSLLRELASQPSLAFSDSSQTEAERDQAQQQVLWDLTDIQRIQETVYHVKKFGSIYEARAVLNENRIQENLPQALHYFNLSRASSPIQPVVHLRIGEILGALYALSAKGQGDEDIERALGLAPSNGNFRLVAGVHYLQSDKPEEAAPHLRRYLELMPRESKYLFNLISGRESRTITYVSEELAGLKLIPDDAKMLYQYAVDYVTANSDVKAKILERASEVLEKQTEAKREFTILSGDIKRAQGELDVAIEEYRIALVSRPNDPNTRYKMAQLLEQTERLAEALEQAEILVRGPIARGEYKTMLNRLSTRIKDQGK